ncbi:hypothetical protein [Billgrantia desiderata]|uniref:hypothetical protein n=1 Tax=Billgrantia desiderata TaxID=52021 RepID=UPI001F439EAC|nr:hypothetical protein [Halomonas desiderata]MCE8012854.1 hypothetical protein [Halomonas desiderata]
MDTTIKQTVITNNVPRDVINGCELTEKERAEFDYVDDDDVQCRPFVRYKGELYDLADLMRVPPGGDLERQGWHAYADDSAFSCIVFKYADDYNESVICGRAHW